MYRQPGKANKYYCISELWTGKPTSRVNDVKVGQHTGGFTPFYFDITSALNKGNNQLVVKVWDPSDRGEQPRGKQVERPGGIWYTPVTGIGRLYGWNR